MLERKAALNGFKILLNLQGKHGNLVFVEGKLQLNKVREGAVGNLTTH